MTGAILIASLSYFITRYKIIEKEKQLCKSKLEKYIKVYNENGAKALGDYFSVQNHTIDFSYLRIISNDSEVFLINSPLQNVSINGLNELKKIPLDNIVWEEIENLSNKELKWIINTKKLDDNTYIQFAKLPISAIGYLDLLLYSFVKVALPLIFICGLLATYLTILWIKPLATLANNVRNALNSGELDKEIPSFKNNKELDGLVTLFNDILKKNHQLITTMNDSLNSVAHDLRTPMTRFKSNAEFALKDNDEERLREALINCIDESDQILTMLNTLMSLAEAEAGVLKLNKDTTTIDEILSNVIEMYEFIAEEKNITINKTLNSETKLNVDKNRMFQVFANLLDNAIKYSPENTTISINSIEDKTKIIIEVKDQGCGVAQADINNIFKKLYRCDRSRTKKGLGLGLSMVKSIVEAHNGKITIESELNIGSCFKVELPKPF
jgi:signal transduction histidine kinase